MTHCGSNHGSPTRKQPEPLALHGTNGKEILIFHFAGSRAVIVGERPRDRLVFWAEGGEIQLPNSKIEIPISTGMHDWARGCRDWSRCHWPNIWYGSIGVGNVEPDVRVGWRISDYRRGIDTVLARALEAP